MRISTIALASAALAFGSNAALAQAAPLPCLTTSEVETVAGFLLPSLIEGTAEKCRVSLAPQSYLRTSAPALASRYRSENRADWQRARPIIEKLAGDRMPTGLGGEFGAKLMETVVVAALVEEIKPKHCATADRLAETLSPLPATNMARLVGMLLELGAKDDKPGSTDVPFRICPSPAAG